MKNNKSISSLIDKRQEQLSGLRELISVSSTQFSNAPVSEIDGNIKQALKQLGECLDIDSCTFWEISENRTDLQLVHHYVVPKLHQIALEINRKDLPWIFKMIMVGDYICFNRLEDLPEEAAIDKESLRLRGIKSFILIPYHIAGKAIACLTFCSIEKEKIFPPGLISGLKLIGEIITSALYRKKMEEKYQKYVEEAQNLDEQIPPGDFHLRQETKNECSYEGIIGNSAVMKLVFSRMEQVAPTDSVVLILGETGTGKGALALAIHELSRRKDKKIVTVNCAALTPSLIESELFGREKGAYTGSTEMQIGRFELADKGTLVLDEITELPLDLQAKLLRAIQEGEFERLGSPKTIKVDVRILALTSRNLKEEVLKGRFRQDLYYRINVFPITMPPLRERHDDISLLAEEFLEQFNRRMQKEIKTISKHTMTELIKYSWPGNVRELKHIIERAVIMTRGTSLHLTEKLDDSESHISEEHFITKLAEVEKRHILKILEKTNWRIDGSKGAAILLGLHPNTLRGRMQKLGISLQKSS
jgi:formate hydrogenlyase transcriptional activator